MTAAIALRQPHSEWLARLRTIGLGLGGRGVMGLGLGRSSVSAAAGNGLLNNLIAYYPLNEATGTSDALDAHASKTALQYGEPGVDTGLVYATARSFAGPSSVDYFYRADAAFRFGDTDFTVAAWLYNLQTPAALRYAVTCYYAGIDREWALLLAATGYYRFFISADGTTLTQPSATTFGLVPVGTWNLVIGQYDSVTDLVSISVNAGTLDSLPHVGGAHIGSAVLNIGNAQNNTAAWYGRIGPVAIWKSAAGAGGVLTAAQRTALYNGGAGLAYAAFTT